MLYRGAEFIEKHLSQDDIFCYWRKLLTEYAKLQKFKPTLNPEYKLKTISNVSLSISYWCTTRLTTTESLLCARKWIIYTVICGQFIEFILPLWVS